MSALGYVSDMEKHTIFRYEYIAIPFRKMVCS